MPAIPGAMFKVSTFEYLESSSLEPWQELFVSRALERKTQGVWQLALQIVSTKAKISTISIPMIALTVGHAKLSVRLKRFLQMRVFLKIGKAILRRTKISLVDKEEVVL